MAENLPGPRASSPPPDYGGQNAGGTPALPDEALAQALQQMGIATFDQMEAARAEQAAQAKNGIPVSLADALVRRGLIAPATLENVVKKVQARAAGGIKQLGPYKLIRKLGEGGMGQVFLAEDINAGRMVAVKVLAKKLADDLQFLTRFRREAQSTGKLNHVNIVCAYTVGEEQGIHYYAMECCDGEPLDVLLDRVPFIPWRPATGVIIQVVQGLKHAHEQGIIHRDIKPANIFICRPGTAGVSPAPESQSPLDIFAEGFIAKILDLGLSKDLGNESSSFYTQTGVAMGTPDYISPEQAKGEKLIDGRTDIYSLGATFYHLVTGETPFSGSTGAIVMMKHLTEQLPNPQDINDEVPDGVVHIIQRMMAKAPDDRYTNCKELLEDLNLVIDGKMPSSPAIDVSKSSVAAARKRLPRAAAVTRQGMGRNEPADGAGRRGIRRRDPVDHRSGKAGPEAQPAGKKPTVLVTAAAAALLLAVVVLMLTMGGNDKPPTTKAGGSGKPDQTPAQPTNPSTTLPPQPKPEANLTPTAPVASQPVRTTPMPGTGGWPLHDGKEPIADYAKKVGLQATETLDLGGGVTMAVLLVPAGDFPMGGPGKRQSDWQGNEGPIHNVTITKPFYLAKYPVTVAQFSQFVDATKYVTQCEKAGNKASVLKSGRWGEQTGVNWRSPSFDQTPDHPVVLVSWNDAQEFCTWANTVARASGLRYLVGLPTEAQWEWAARGQKSLEYPFGKEWDGKKVNHRDTALKNSGWLEGGCSSDNDGYAYTSPVGKFSNASWCGAFDLSGNVWQWVQDWEADYKADAQIDPVGPGNGQRHVVRGGSWVNLPESCRAAARGRYHPDGRVTFYGFRVVLVVPKTP